MSIVRHCPTCLHLSQRSTLPWRRQAWLWPRVVAADILAEVLGSDHCPIQLTLR